MSKLIATATIEQQIDECMDEGDQRVRITQKGGDLLDGKPVNGTPIAAHRTVRLTEKGRAYLDELDQQRAESENPR